MIWMTDGFDIRKLSDSSDVRRTVACMLSINAIYCQRMREHNRLRSEPSNPVILARHSRARSADGGSRSPHIGPSCVCFQILRRRLDPADPPDIPGVHAMFNYGCSVS
jgi:hypothetical protein